MSEYSYTLLLEQDPEDKTYTVTVPALPGIVTQGDTIPEAIAMGIEAIELHVQGLIEDGLPVPVETERPQLVTVKVRAAA